MKWIPTKPFVRITKFSEISDVKINTQNYVFVSLLGSLKLSEFLDNYVIIALKGTKITYYDLNKKIHYDIKQRNGNPRFHCRKNNNNLKWRKK